MGYRGQALLLRKKASPLALVSYVLVFGKSFRVGQRLLGILILGFLPVYSLVGIVGFGCGICIRVGLQGRPLFLGLCLDFG